ncbi:origin recognition complex subunit 4-like [Teleopsis dalmanni]|uniref:origin recognition complex subunit 4-like n=1 Tax=Teleopsis dalmanni TaxID=139649 RepID=UPI0018CCF431|nr:origin recognition complex subunit 4-like [Teleopsis dalmanni]
MSTESHEINHLRRFLKERLQRDYTTFRGHENERNNIRTLLQRTAEYGESNSMLLIGPEGSGKTTLVNAVITDLLSNKDFLTNTLIVVLDGGIHTDDRLALKSATTQMKLENAVDGKVFGSFAENLAFLLASLKSGNKSSKSVIFILEQFDLFCTHHNQTLLYNLFDVSQSAQAPICVLGITRRLDVVELLEKRVKSRFSHRQIFLYPEADKFEEYVTVFQELLSIPSESEIIEYKARVKNLELLESDEITFQYNHFNPALYKFSSKFTRKWNTQISKLICDNNVVQLLQRLFDYDVTEAFLKNYIFRLVMQLDVDTHPQLTVEQVKDLVTLYELDHKVEMLLGLNVLELCLIIAIKHHSEIYDRDPFNFEIIFQRFSKFAKVSSTMQGIERGVILKSFEYLRNIELILPVTGSNSNKVVKETEMHQVALTYGQINQAVQKYQALPTEVSQWAQSSLI